MVYNPNDQKSGLTLQDPKKMITVGNKKYANPDSNLQMSPQIYKEMNRQVDNNRHVLNLSDMNVKHAPLESKLIL